MRELTLLQDNANRGDIETKLVELPFGMVVKIARIANIEKAKVLRKQRNIVRILESVESDQSLIRIINVVIMHRLLMREKFAKLPRFIQEQIIEKLPVYIAWVRSLVGYFKNWNLQDLFAELDIEETDEEPQTEEV